jgi:hypothetical protein
LAEVETAIDIGLLVAIVLGFAVLAMILVASRLAAH